METLDELVLKNPEAEIIDKGGMVFFARDRWTGEVFGACALMAHGDTWELTKMGVLPHARGRKAGLKLGQAVIDFARRKGLPDIMLETNSSLTPAITLYRKLGFVQVPIDEPSGYDRADVRMVLQLT